MLQMTDYYGFARHYNAKNKDNIIKKNPGAYVLTCLQETGGTAPGPCLGSMLLTV